VCAEYLGARFEDIRVRGGDTALLPYGFGTGASRVAVNTGNAVADAAEAVKLNPTIVDGQVLGGFAQGLGVALGECLVYDDAGQLLTGSLMDYPIPRADDIPEFVTEHLHFPTDHNRLGTRGVGEGPTGPPPAAIANAVADAFDGRLNIRFPVLTPARVHALLQESGITNPNHVYNSS
jgi:carbon-monoxide dehydrogenase large subunit